MQLVGGIICWDHDNLVAWLGGRDSADCEEDVLGFFKKRVELVGIVGEA